MRFQAFLRAIYAGYHIIRGLQGFSKCFRGNSVNDSPVVNPRYGQIQSRVCPPAGEIDRNIEYEFFSSTPQLPRSKRSGLPERRYLNRNNAGHNRLVSNAF